MTDNATISDDLVLRPNLVNHFQLGYTRFYAEVDNSLGIGVKVPGDPVFAAHDAQPFSLHTDGVADGSVVSILSLPGNGDVTLADGTAVAAGSVLSASDFAGIKFAPLDTDADNVGDFRFSVSDGTSQTVSTIPVHVLSGSDLNITPEASQEIEKAKRR